MKRGRGYGVALWTASSVAAMGLHHSEGSRMRRVEAGPRIFGPSAWMLRPRLPKVVPANERAA